MWREQRYESPLVAALRDIAADPHRPGSVARPELGRAVRNIIYGTAVAARERPETASRCGNRATCCSIARCGRPDRSVGRVLYDGMELERHVPPRLWRWATMIGPLRRRPR